MKYIVSINGKNYEVEVEKGRANIIKTTETVVADVFLTETAQFWREPGLNPAEIPTEVIFLPAAFVYEKAGSMTNSSRLIQWKEAAIPPLNGVHPDLDMLEPRTSVCSYPTLLITDTRGVITLVES
jgi:anaerobic selenocysteine-containing dehydrogenase